jgi:Nuclease-related domain
MAWPRIKNSRSSAQPGTQPHTGVQATVTPAADAEPPPRSSHNTGVAGTRYAVAETPGSDTRSPRHDRSTSRRLGPIRYAHSGVDEPPAANGGDGDADSGLVYEAPQGGIGAPLGSPPGPSATATSAFETDEADEAGASAESAGPADQGISIFGDMATTEVPDDAEPTLDFRTLRRPAAGQPPTPDREPADAERTDPIPIGSAWNQPSASSARPVDPAAESQPRPFGSRVGGLRPPAPARDGQARVSVRDLPPDVQIRFWRTRAIIMIVVGLLFGILTKNWMIGLTLAILAGIIDTLYRSRNAADYQNGASQSGAQKRTRKQLKRMRRDGYFALDARPIPDSREVIDHLVVGPTGVYAIDSEKWDAKVPVRTLNGKRLYRGPESQKERLEHAAWEAGQASEILSAALGTEISVRPALAIYGPRIPWDIATIRNVDVFSGPTLRKYLRRRARQRDGAPKLTREEVRTIYDTAARMLPDVAPTRTVAPVG